MERIPVTLLSEPEGGCINPGNFDGENSIYSEAPPSELRTVRWLIEVHNIRVVPYAAVSRTSELKATVPYLGIGAPVSMEAFPSYAINSLARQSSIASELARSSPLAGAEREFEEIGHIKQFIGSPILAGPAATEPAVREALRRPPAILHFATHALDPASAPGIIEPIIVLSQSGRIGTYDENDDGVLSSSEISSLKLPETIVILSACRTASPKRGVGRGIFSGLVQSFFDAGAGQAIATYWLVDDSAAAEIVPRALNSMASGVSMTDALRDAQLSYIFRQRKENSNENYHPYYWASFIAVEPRLKN
jgi:CHAT domain-containing protein